MTINNDPMGAAIADFFATGKAKTLEVLSPMFDDDIMPIETLFRTFPEMQHIEQTALNEARGNILDVGAGSGCHSIVLQQMGKRATAIDISPLSVETMKKRGIADARLQDLFEMDGSEKFDTLLMLMNGAGICGTLDRLPDLLNHLKTLLAPGGQILMDSSDLRYLYEDENGDLDLEGVESYYGEVVYQMRYGDIMGEAFPWLYVDYNTLQGCAEACGLHCELLVEGNHYDYLCRITL